MQTETRVYIIDLDNDTSEIEIGDFNNLKTRLCTIIRGLSKSL